MARRSLLYHFHGERVQIAVRRYANYVLDIAALLALAPQLFAGAGEKARSALLYGYFQALLIHICQREHFFRVVVLHYCGDKPAAVKLQIVDVYHFFSLYAHGYTVCLEHLLQIFDVHFFKVEYGSGKSRVRARNGLEQRDKVLRLARSAGSYHGYVH